MLSQQNYTSSRQNTEQPAKRPCNVCLTTNTHINKTDLKLHQRCPKNIRIENIAIKTNETSTPIQISPTQYARHLGRECFDPTTVNTPPNEFMLNLKERLQLYFNG